MNQIQCSVFACLVLAFQTWHVSGTSADNHSRCEPLTIPMCLGWGNDTKLYNYTKVPNSMNHGSQEEAALELHQFWPLVRVGCSRMLQGFLCFHYAPPCDMPTGWPDIRSMCEEAKNGCEPLMNKFGFTWPANLSCTQYPVVSDSTQPPHVSETSPDNHSHDPRCEPLTIPMCLDWGNNTKLYTYTRVPNSMNHGSQEEAAMELHQFWPLVRVRCSRMLQGFLCFHYAPPCDMPTGWPDIRSMCEEAKNGCEPLMNKFGFTWPANLSCTQYPALSNFTQPRD